jgi:parallel beta-helix repeat protein
MHSIWKERINAVAFPLAALGVLGGFFVFGPASANAATLSVGASGADYTSIQAAVDAASGGDTISILPGTYTGNISLNKSVTIMSSGSAAETTVNGIMTVSVSGVTIDGLAVTDPSNPHAILVSNSSGISDVSIINNELSAVGTTLAMGSAQAIYVSGACSDITISGNTISDVGQLANLTVSTKGIYVGSTGLSGEINGLVISDNMISGIKSTRGAYGIQINFGGSTNAAQITGNVISDLEGLWACGIGLERNTPNAVVTGNTISGVVDHKGGIDNSGIKIEDNPSADQIIISLNNFAAAIIGVQNLVADKTVIAENNWWGTPSGASIKTQGLVNFTPWYVDEAMTTLSSEILTVGAGKMFAVIQEAIDAASVGATIDVYAGTYAENIAIAKSVTLEAAEDGAILNPAPVGPAEAIITISGADTEATVDGFEIDGLGAGSYGIYADRVGDVVITDSDISGYLKNGILINGSTAAIDGNTITGNAEMTGFTEDAIYTMGGSTVAITGNTISGNKNESVTSTASGISVHANDVVTITGNTITGNSYGIHVKGSGSASEGDNPIVVASENKIYGNETLNFFFEYRGIAPASLIDARHNWWGSASKIKVAAGIATRAEDSTEKMENYVSFDPWYVNDKMKSLSNASAGNAVVLK